MTIEGSVFEKRQQCGGPVPFQKPADQGRALAIKNPLSAEVGGLEFQFEKLLHGPGLAAGDRSSEIGLVSLPDDRRIEEHRQPFVGPTGWRGLDKPVTKHDMDEFVIEGVGDVGYSVAQEVDSPQTDAIAGKLERRGPAGGFGRNAHGRGEALRSRVHMEQAHRLPRSGSRLSEESRLDGKPGCFRMSGDPSCPVRWHASYHETGLERGQGLCQSGRVAGPTSSCKSSASGGEQERKQTAGVVVGHGILAGRARPPAASPESENADRVPS